MAAGETVYQDTATNRAGQTMTARLVQLSAGYAPDGTPDDTRAQHGLYVDLHRPDGTIERGVRGWTFRNRPLAAAAFADSLARARGGARA